MLRNDLCCVTQAERTASIKTAITSAISTVISSRCNCSFSESIVQDGLFSCWNSPTEVTYRSTIVSTDNASMLVGYIEDWVRSEQPFLRVGDFRLQLYQDCPVHISSMSAPECVSAKLPTDGPSVIASSDPVITNCLNYCLVRVRGEPLCSSP